VIHHQYQLKTIRIFHFPLLFLSLPMHTNATSGNNDGNEDGTKNAFYTSSRYRTTKPLFEDIDNRNITLRSPDPDSYVHGIDVPPFFVVNLFLLNELVRITSIVSKLPNSSAFLYTHNLRLSIENKFPLISSRRYYMENMFTSPYKGYT
jgi:hypothetical protein